LYLIPGTSEHLNTGTLEHQNTPEHQNTGTPEHSGTPEKPGALNLTVLFCFSITDHEKIKCQCNLFTHITRTRLEAGAKGIAKKVKRRTERTKKEK